MAQPNRLVGNTHIDGTLSANAITYPSGSILSTSLQRHRIYKHYSQEAATAVSDTAVTYPIHVVSGATAALSSFKAGSVVAGLGGATCTFDLKKNGASIITAVISLDNTNTAYVPETAAFTAATAAGVANDVYSVVIDGNAGGGTALKGVFCEMVIDEDA